MTREEIYCANVTHGKTSCALALLAYWERSWSWRAERYALHALATAHRAGLDVLELAREASGLR